MTDKLDQQFIDRIKNADTSGDDYEYAFDGSIMICDTHVDNKPDTNRPWIPLRAEAQDTYNKYWMNKEYKRLLAQVMAFPPSKSERKRILKELGHE